MSRDPNQAPQEQQQPTGGTTIPKHPPAAPRVHDRDKPAPKRDKTD